MIADLPDLIAKRAELTPDKGRARGGRDRAAADLCRARRSRRPCRRLDGGRGVGAGDRVAILCRNRIEFFELLFGCAKLAPSSFR
jgi:fatty-acyl-CoA synthase